VRRFNEDVDDTPPRLQFDDEEDAEQFIIHLRCTILKMKTILK
jgi:hypothetical protein